MTGPLTPDELGDYIPERLADLESEQLRGEAAYLANAERLAERALEAVREQLRRVRFELDRREAGRVAA